MVRSTAILSTAYLAEYAFFEVLGGLRKRFQAKVVREQGLPDLAEQLGLRFPIMVCVLLVGIELRAVQLRLELDTWMSVAMYLTVLSIVAQAVWACIVATLRFIPQAGVAAEDAPGAARRLLRGSLMVVWGTVLLVLYLGTATILVSVFVMEERPLESLIGYTALFGYHYREQGELSGHTKFVEKTLAVPPLSTAMRCVMLLTAVYFVTYLCMILASIVAKRWAKSVLEGVQGALAFVPMLCVMMIGVRLRAMQLRVRDPQQWAQISMYVATMAVATQAFCCLFTGANSDNMQGDDNFDDDKPGSSNILWKVVLIVSLAVRYIAAMVLYACMAVLVVALLLMEPAVQR